MTSSPTPGANTNWAQSAILYNADGNPIPLQSVYQHPSNVPGISTAPPAPPTPPIMSADLEIAGIKKNLGFLNWIAAAGVAALIGLYFILSGQIDSRFDKAGSKIEHVSDQVSDLRVSGTQQASDVKAILEKVEANPSQGSTARANREARGTKDER